MDVIQGSLPIITHEYIHVNPSPPYTNLDSSVGEYVLEVIKTFGNKKAMVNSMTNEIITYNDILKQSKAVAMALKARGIKEGDVVGITSENRFEFAPVFLGSLVVGASVSPLNHLYNIDEWIHVLSISQPSIVFVSPYVLNNFDLARKKVSFIKEIITFGEPNNSFISYSEIIKTPIHDFVYPKINPSECVAFLLCSSGTTGLPKCVELTHKNMMCVINFVGQLWKSPDQNKENATLGLVPFFHGFGCILIIRSLLTNLINVVMPRFDERIFLESIQNYQISTLFLVPPLVVFLSKHPLVSKYDLSCVKKILCGAAPLSKETQVLAQSRLKLESEIYQAYGMTELSLCVLAFQTETRKLGSSGTVAPMMEAKVIDLESGKNLPPHNSGELCFRGPFVMKGYRNNPKATKECFDTEGWFHTGDIAYYDEDGFFFIVDRLKELIKYKGFQVAPAELETILLTHPKIKEAAVVGLPHEEAGELPLAFVVKQPNVNVTEDEIKKFIADKVSPQKKLHGGVRFINEIPKNPSGKILRRELRAMLKKSKL